MNKFTFIFLVASLGLAGTYSFLRGSTTLPPVPESTIEQLAPTSVGQYSMLPPTDPTQQDKSVSYKMDPATYKTLDPWGIVAREMSDGTHTYDTVLIAGQASAFHDPTICFRGQSYEILDQQTGVIQDGATSYPCTILRLQNKTLGIYSAAVYLYKGPDGYYPNVNELFNDFFSYHLHTGKAPWGVFYRFIDSDQNDVAVIDQSAPSTQRFFKFIAAYMKKVHETSGGQY